MVRLDKNKSFTEDKSIESLPLPEKVFIPLIQHIGRPATPQVRIGDLVYLGQKLASSSSTISTSVHTSVSGRIVSLQDWPHPVLGKARTIVIENDKKDTSLFTPRSHEQIDRLTPEEIRGIVFEAGIVGMGGAGFPTHIKLNPPKSIDTLIINGAECEPYLTGDYRLMVEKTKEILKGIELISRCLRAKDVFIAIEDDKPEAIKAFNHGLCNTGYGLRILRSYYPQGGEKQLIKNILGKEVPTGKLPFDVGVVVHNVATAFAIYEAVYFNKPLYERVVTVTGNCLNNPKNLLVRIGTPIRELIDFCGPLQKQPFKIIIGGPMMGIAQYTDDVPVIKTTTAVILLDREEAALNEEKPCIRCGACVKECPMGLMPCLINLVSQKGLWFKAEELGAMDCIECGLCSYVCPAKRRLVQSIKRAKLEIR
ncbi:MAG: electron transport complex subunit RsxC [Candidatus Omnitrophica bacterium]|nr:electron transport complex subunit RsxC [Candidatus Omnitrophota bacterium]